MALPRLQPARPTPGFRKSLQEGCLLQNVKRHSRKGQEGEMEDQAVGHKLFKSKTGPQAKSRASAILYHYLPSWTGPPLVAVALPPWTPAEVGSLVPEGDSVGAGSGTRMLLSLATYLGVSPASVGTYGRGTARLRLRQRGSRVPQRISKLVL